MVLFGEKVSCWVWSAVCSDRAWVRIKNSSKHIVISHPTSLISTALHTHCLTELASFPEEFNLSLSLFSSSPVPPTSSSFQPLSSPNSLAFSFSLLLILFDLHPSPMFSIKLHFLEINYSIALCDCKVFPLTFFHYFPSPLFSILFFILPQGAGYWCKHTELRVVLKLLEPICRPPSIVLEIVGRHLISNRLIPSVIPVPSIKKWWGVWIGGCGAWLTEHAYISVSVLHCGNGSKRCGQQARGSAAIRYFRPWRKNRSRSDVICSMQCFSKVYHEISIHPSLFLLQYHQYWSSFVAQTL